MRRGRSEHAAGADEVVLPVAALLQHGGGLADFPVGRARVNHFSAAALCQSGRYAQSSAEPKRKVPVYALERVFMGDTARKHTKRGGYKAGYTKIELRY